MKYLRLLAVSIIYLMFGIIFQKINIIHHPVWWSAYGFIFASLYFVYLIKSNEKKLIINAGGLIKNELIVCVEIKGLKILAFRLWLGQMIFVLASKVIGCGINIETNVDNADDPEADTAS